MRGSVCVRSYRSLEWSRPDGALVERLTHARTSEKGCGSSRTLHNMLLLFSHSMFFSELALWVNGFSSNLTHDISYAFAFFLRIALRLWAISEFPILLFLSSASPSSSVSVF